MDIHTPPPIPWEVVEWLSLRFPDTLPPAETPQHEMLALCGEQRVIRQLRKIVSSQNKDHTVLEEIEITTS